MMKMKPSIKELIEYKKDVTKMPNVTEQDLQSGCTAIVVAVTKDKFICANAGDSRAALCRKSGVEALS
jgi:serine/threonine protein phosphatase PrpC